MTFTLRCLCLTVLAAWVSLAQAGVVRVAVAANFSAPMQQIAQAFAQDTGHQAQLAIGSTGKFYAQIRNGAPFDLFLAADQATPERLEQEGLAQKGTRFSYAIGRLVLWSPQPQRVDDAGRVLRGSTFEHLAIADPRLAPYGAAAVEVLQHLNLLAALQPRLVQGESIAQAYQFVASGNAELGFVALSQVLQDGHMAAGSAWIVPETLHAPLRQDAVILSQAQDAAATRALAAYLQTERARAIIRAYGYGF